MKTAQKYVLLLLLFISAEMAAQTTVSGTVTEKATGTPLPGVNVIVKGTSTGTTTDFDGNYQIQAPNGSVLVFSYIGFKNFEATVTGSTVNVALEEDAQQLDEVVVIGYGTTTVKDATGAVTAVTSKDFTKGNIVTAENLLNGRVAGVSINTSGAPGSGSAIRIRGGASLDASNDPLIVIDGLPLENATTGGSRSFLASLNPDDIDSFSILKDASATAIYGSRASNGVIIITTKKGSKNFSLDVSLQTGIGTLANKIDVFNAAEFRELISNHPNAGALVPLLGNANTDWQDEIYQSALQSNQNITINGNLFEVLPSRLSFGRIYQEGLRLTEKFERNTVSVALNPSLLDDHLRININANSTFEKNRFTDGVEGTAILFDPTQPVRDPNSPFGGFFEYFQDNGDGEFDGDDLVPNSPGNPVASLLQRNNISNVRRFFGNANFNYKFHFLPELSATVNLGYDYAEGEGTNELSRESRATNQNQFVGSKVDYTNQRTNKLFDAFLTYDKEFGQLGMKLTTGYSYQKFEDESFTTNEQRDDTPGSEPESFTSTPLVLIGYFGRGEFSLNQKYFLTVSVRRDGTSRFINNNRWGYFPAAAFAWRISDENFMKGSNVISNLKLRLGYGVTGQQDIGGRSDYLAAYSIGQPNSQLIFGGQIIAPGTPQFRNEDLKWEETTQYNIGLDYGLFNGRINGTIEGFYKQSDDLLAFAAISDGSNFSNAGFQNNGSFIAKGLEFSVDAQLANSDNFQWNVNYNLTYIDTKVDQLALGQDVIRGGIGGGTGNTIQINREGFAPNSFYVYNQVYDTNGNPIEGAYSDLNGDNIINANDLYIYRNPDADVLMGFQSTMNYKNFDFAFNLRASLGNYVYNNVNSSRAQFSLLDLNGIPSNIPSSYSETLFNETANVILSDYFIENASFLRMDNITLGYTFKDIVSDRSSIRLWTGVQNVFVITEYSGLDPEIFGGIDNTIYPRPRTYLLGANLKF